MKINPSSEVRGRLGILPLRQLGAVFATALLGSVTAHGAALFWDTNGTDPGSGAATGIWGTDAFFNTDPAGGAGTFGAATAVTDDVTFSAGSNGTAGTVSVNGTQLVNSLTLNQPGLTFTDGTINMLAPATGALTVNASATINSAFTGRGIVFATAGQTLKFGGGSTSFLTASAASGPTPANPAIAQSSTIELTAGTYTQGGGIGTYNIGSATTGTGGLVVDSGATYNSAVSFQAGNNGTGLINLNGGTINQTNGNSVVGRGGGVTGRLIVSSGLYNHSSAGHTMLIAFQGATGILDVQGGTLTIADTLGLNSPGGAPGAGGTATVNISGNSVTTVQTIDFGKASDFAGIASSGSGTLNVTGGSLYIGSGGIIQEGTDAYTSAINVSGGTIGVKTGAGAWSSSLGMTLGTTNGNITFKAADASDVANNITLTGKLTGAGGFTKTGAGTLTVGNATNDYSGATVVSAGVLLTDASGVLGAGNVAVGSGAILTLGNFNSINNVGDLSVFANSTVNLNFSGSETVHSLFNATSGTFLAPNTYTVAQLNAIFGTTTFATNSSGTLTVLAVPEPRIWGLLMLGGVFVLWKRRRVAAQA